MSPLHANQRQAKRAIRKDEQDLVAKPIKQPKVSYDRTYYNSLIENASKRRWAFTTAVHYATEDKGFDCDGNSVPLATTVFGTCPITIDL